MLEMGSMEVQFSKKAESSPWPPVSLGKGEAADIYWLVFDRMGCNLAAKPIICVERLSGIPVV